MKKKFLFILILLIGQKSFAQPLNGNYSVGTPLSDYFTIADAISDLSLKGVSGPVVFDLENRVYPERVIIPKINGMSAINTVTIHSKNDNASETIINSTIEGGLANDCAQIILNDADYFIIKNITINNFNPNYAIGVLLTNHADHNIIRNCIINCDSSLVETDGLIKPTHGGIVVSGLPSDPNAYDILSTSGYSGSNNLLESNTINSGFYGIALSGKSTDRGLNNMVKANTISTQVTSVQVYYNANYTILNNSTRFTTSKNTYNDLAPLDIRLSGKGQILSNTFYIPYEAYTTITADTVDINNNLFTTDEQINNTAYTYFSFTAKELTSKNNTFLGSNNLNFNGTNINVEGNTVEGRINFVGTNGLSRILKNKILKARNTSFGVISSGLTMGLVNAQGLVANNMIVISSTLTSENVGVGFFNHSQLLFEYNTLNSIVDPNDTNFYSAPVFVINGTQLNPDDNSAKVIVRNNVFASQGTGSVFKTYRTGLSRFDFDYNDVYCFSRPLASVDNSELTDLNDFQRFTNKGLNCVFRKPKFVNDTLDLHVSGYATNGVGVPDSIIYSDYDAEIRDLKSPDAGADEIKYEPNDDIGILDFTPIKSIFGNNTISVNLMNFGVQSLAGKNIGLSFSKDNGSTWTPTENYTIKGLTKQFDTETYNFNAKYNAPYGKSPILIRINAPGVSTDINKLNDTLSGSICVEFPGDTLVVGSTNSDFTKIQDAINFIIKKAACGLSNPVLINVKPGTYNETLYIPRLIGTSEKNNITIQSSTGKNNDVIVSTHNYGTGSQGEINSTLYLNGVQNLIIKNITFQNLANAQDYGSTNIANTFYLYNVKISGISDHIKFLNCEFKMDTGYNILSDELNIVTAQNVYCVGTNVVFDQDTLTGGTYGFFLQKSFDYPNINDTIRNCVIQKIATYGIYATSIALGAKDYVSLSNNKIYVTSTVQGYGIVVTQMNYLNIEGNEVNYPGLVSSDRYGIIVNTTYNALIQANKILGASAIGLVINGGSDLKVYNNMLSNFNQSKIKVHNNDIFGYQTVPYSDLGAGVYVYNPLKIKFYNNSISYDALAIDTSIHNYTICVDFGGSNISSMEMHNNIFSNTANGPIFYFSKLSNLKKSNYNNFYFSGKTFGEYATAKVSNFAQWKTDSKLDSNSLNINPNFTSKTDLHIVTAGVDGKGKYFPEYPRDFDREPRDEVKPDIGADEYSLSLIDVGISDINLKQAYVGNNNLSVTLRNYGNSNLVNKIVPMTFSIDSGKTWSNSENFTIKTLTKFGTEEVVNFNTKLNVSQLRKYSVWVKINPKLTGDIVQSNDSLAQEICVILKGGTYSVGNSSSDFPNLSVLSQLMSGIVCPIEGSVVFNLEPKTYYEKINFGIVPGASQQNTITIQSVTGNPNDVIVEFGKNLQNDNSTISFQGTQFVDLKNISIKNTGANYANGISMTGHFNIVENCNIIMDTNTLNNNVNGIWVNDTLGNNTVIRNNKILGAYNAIKLTGTSSFQNSNFEVVNNTISNSTTYGINSIYTHIDSLYGNKISMKKGNTQFSFGISLLNCANATRIMNNSIRYGTVTLSNINHTNKSIFANNFIYEQANNIWLYGLYIENSKNVDIAFNTVSYANSQNSALTTAFYITKGTNQNILNNIFYNANNGYAYYAKDTLGIRLSDNNDLFTNNGKIGFWKNDAITLADFQQKSNREKNSISIKPVFVSESDLHTHQDELDNKAIPVPGINFDIDHQPRNASTPDIGADEFTNGLDLAINSVITPNVNILENGKEYNFTLSLSNKGNQAVNSFDISYSVNGGTPVHENFNGTILPGNQTNYTFSSKVVPQKGDFQICFNANLNNDLDYTNNSLCKSYTIIDSVSKGLDGGVAEILSPVGSNLYANKNYPVSVNIINLGSNTISNFKVAYSVNGFEKVVETFTSAINPGQQKSYTFRNTYRAFTGTIKLCAYTKIDNDINLNNDSQCADIEFIDSTKNDIIDGLVSQIVGPDQTNLNAVKKYPFKIKIKNIGTTTIANFPVNMIVNGINVAHENYNLSILAGDSDIYTFNTLLSVNIGTANVCASVEVPGDVNTGNDQLCRSYIVLDSTKTGINKLSTSSISIYPNPTNGYLMVTSKINQTPLIFKIVNAIGQTVSTVSLIHNKQLVSVENLNPGVYIGRIYENDSEIFMEKIIIQK